MLAAKKTKATFVASAGTVLALFVAEIGEYCLDRRCFESVSLHFVGLHVSAAVSYPILGTMPRDHAPEPWSYFVRSSRTTSIPKRKGGKRGRQIENHLRLGNQRGQANAGRARGNFACVRRIGDRPSTISDNSTPSRSWDALFGK